MSGKDWKHFVERNRASQETDGSWGDVGAQWRDAQKVSAKPGNETGDEIRWGASLPLKFDITGVITVDGGPLRQMISAKMAARAWQVQLAVALTAGPLPTGGNDFGMLFAIENGVGSAKVLHYVEFTRADLIVWAFPDDPFPPVASTTIELPARDLIISARAFWQSDGAQNGAKVLTAYAMVSPIMR